MTKIEVIKTNHVEEILHCNSTTETGRGAYVLEGMTIMMMIVVVVLNHINLFISIIAGNIIRVHLTRAVIWSFKFQL